MKLTNNTRVMHRRGLTLMELVVVLLVLVAVGGIVVARMPSMVDRSHDASSASNIPELNKAVDMQTALTGNHGDNYDSLTTGSALVSYLPPAAGEITLASNVTADDVVALNAAGIVNVVHLVEQPDPVGEWSPTLFPYGDDQDVAPISTAITTTNIAELDPLAAQRELGQDPTGRYVIFGVGKYADIVGTSIAEPPTHFAKNPAMGPDKRYGRFAVVYKVADADGSLAKAKYAGAVAIMMPGVRNADSHIADYHEIVDSDQ